MLRLLTKLGPSSIHGIGLFAAEDIGAGTVVWQKDLLDMEVSMFWMPRNLRDYGYLRDDGNWVLCADDARFFNHSETPNCGDLEGPDEVVVALRNISAGEELTCNYWKFDQDASRKLARMEGDNGSKQS